MPITLRVESYAAEPPANPLAVSFGQEGGTVGRMAGNGLTLDDPAHFISRNHARIDFADGRYRWSDIGANPSLVNGRPVGQGRTALLADGDSIVVGQYTLRAAIAAEPDAAFDPDGTIGPGAAAAGAGSPAGAQPACGRPAGAPAPPAANWSGAELPPLPPMPGLPAMADLLAGMPPLPPLPAMDDLAAAPAASRVAPQPAAAPHYMDPLPPLPGTGGAAPAPAAHYVAPLPPLPGAGDAARAPAEHSLDPLPPLPGLGGAGMAPAAIPAIPTGYDILSGGFGADAAAAVLPERPAAPPPAHPGAARPPAAEFPARPAASPSAQAPRTGNAASGSTATDSAVYAALLRGLNLPGFEPDRPPEELAELVGAMLRSATAGTMAMLMARSLVKRENDLPVTMLGSQANNPLKFFPTPDAALELMLKRPRQGYLAPEAAFPNAYDDMKAHWMAMMAGMRTALDCVHAHFAPAAIERGMPQEAMVDRLLPASRKAKLWDRFVATYAQVASDSDEEFQRRFREQFAEAYESQAARLQGDRP